MSLYLLFMGINKWGLSMQEDPREDQSPESEPQQSLALARLGVLSSTGSL